MLCKNCNSEVSEDMEICPVCGAVLKEEPDTEETVSVEDSIDKSDYFDSEEDDDAEEILDQNEVNRQKQIEDAALQKKNQLEEIESRRNQKKRRQKRNRIITICILAALIVAAGGTAVYLLRQGFSNNTPVVITTPMPTSTAEIGPDDVSPSPQSSLPAPPSLQPTQSGTTETDENNASGSSSENGSSSSGSSGTSSGSSSSRGSSSGGSSSGSSTSRGGSSSSSSSTSSRGSSSSSSSSGTSSGGSSSSGSSSGASSSSGSTSASSQEATSNLIYGSRVFEGNDMMLFEFTSNGVTYLAEVSAGSTTADVKDKYFTAMIRPTNERYEGRVIYEIVHMTDTEADGFIISDSSTRVLTAEDLDDISADLLPFARNEIYARHGRKFVKKEYADYFGTRDWYSINPDYDYEDENSNLSEIERQNVLTILNAEQNG